MLGFIAGFIAGAAIICGAFPSMRKKTIRHLNSLKFSIEQDQKQFKRIKFLEHYHLNKIDFHINNLTEIKNTFQKVKKSNTQSNLQHQLNDKQFQDKKNRHQNFFAPRPLQNTESSMEIVIENNLKL